MTSKDASNFPRPMLDAPLEEDIADMVEAIRQSRASDPVVLALQGVEIFRHLSHKYYLERPIHVDAEIRGLCRALVRAKPDCAPLVNLAEDMLKPMKEEYGRAEGERMRADFRARVEQWRGEMLWREEQRALRAARLIEEGARLLCRGYSTDIVGALRQAKSSGLEFSVKCIEGLPQQDGRALVEKLEQYDVAAQVVSDEATPSAMDEASLVLVGAFSLTEEGMVYQAGTYALARMAKERQVPVYALCGLEKFFPANYQPHLVETTKGAVREGSTESVTGGESGPEVDVTPLEYLTGVVTGREILSPDVLPEILAERQVQPRLLG